MIFLVQLHLLAITSKSSLRILECFLVGRRPNAFLELSLNDRTILFLLIFLDKTVLQGRAKELELS